MSEQEMQFADPDWQASSEEARQPARPQPVERSSIIDEQEAALPAWEREKLIVSPEQFARNRFKRRIFLLGLLVTGGVASGLGAWFAHQAGTAVQLPFPSTQPGQKTLSTNNQHVPLGGNQPRIIVNNIAGDVNITGAPINEVVIQTRNEQYTPTAEATSSVSYSLSDDRNTMTINVGYIPGGSSLKNIVLNLQVPGDAALEVHTPYGIYVKDVDGQKVLTNTRDDAGMNIYSNLSGNSSIHAVNSIFFFGSLDPHGTYNFECDNGPVELYLPSDASFQLQAHTDGESISNAFHSNNVGKPPQAKIAIVTHNGLISINERF